MSGLREITPPWEPAWSYIETRACVEWANGSKAFLYSAQEPDKARGPAHHLVAGDELATWPTGGKMGAHGSLYDNLAYGCRIITIPGNRRQRGWVPRMYFVTTPRPTKLIRDITNDPGTVTIRGPT